MIRLRCVLLVALAIVLFSACSSSSPDSTAASSGTNAEVDNASTAAPPSSAIQASTTSPTSTVEATSTTIPLTTSTPSTTTTTAAPPVVRTGASVLVDGNFEILDGQRVGLISHQNSVVDGVHLGDLLHQATNVDLVAMFGPEHGARGDRDAGEYVDDAVDPTTGVPVYSLFGPTRQPTPDMLEGIDVLVYDVQDVGARYYTYISTMGLAMQAAAEANIDFVVLDRPNPLGGQVGGGVLQRANASFVGQYDVPDVYGLTAGELAGWIIERRPLEGLEDLSITVVEMDGWNRSMLWEDTGLDWIAPSPAITSPDAALLYPATIYFEATSMSYGRGTDRPFQLVGAPWLDATGAAAALTDLGLPGVSFEATTFTPEMLPGMSVEPAFLGETVPAIELTVTDAHDIRPTEVGVHLLRLMFDEAAKNNLDPLARPEWLDQLSGSDFLRRSLTEGTPVSDILQLHRRQQSQRVATLDAAHLYD